MNDLQYNTTNKIPSRMDYKAFAKRILQAECTLKLTSFITARYMIKCTLIRQGNKKLPNYIFIAERNFNNIYTVFTFINESHNFNKMILIPSSMRAITPKTFTCITFPRC